MDAVGPIRIALNAGQIMFSQSPHPLRSSHRWVGFWNETVPTNPFPPLRMMWLLRWHVSGRSSNNLCTGPTAVRHQILQIRPRHCWHCWRRTSFTTGKHACRKILAQVFHAEMPKSHALRGVKTSNVRPIANIRFMYTSFVRIVFAGFIFGDVGAPLEHCEPKSNVGAGAFAGAWRLEVVIGNLKAT